MDVTVALLGLLGPAAALLGAGPQGVRRAQGGRPGGGLPLPARAQPRLRRPAARARAGRRARPRHRGAAQRRPRLYEEAGLPSYDADTYRTRRLSELDRAAATGHVPTGLLARWEAALEDVSLWRFAPTPTHGDLAGEQVLAVFEDDEDASTGRVRAFTGWEDAKVADPADDFAALVDRGVARGGRLGAGGLRARPGRAARPATCSCGPAWPPSCACSRALLAGARRAGRRRRRVLRAAAAAAGRAPCTPSEEPDDYRRTSLRPGRACAVASRRPPAPG